MNVLVSLGTNVAFLFSLFLLLTAPEGAHPHLYFEAAALIITLVLFDKWLEDRARRGATAAIRDLMALRPEDARIERDGAQTRLPIALVAVGDIAVVKPGERIPVDGVVADGSTETDDSLTPGESLPQPKIKGDTVTAGAINGYGLIRVTATRVGTDTTLARIVALVAAAQGGKAPIQRPVDRIASVFVPVVVAVAATFALWMLADASLDHAIAAAVSVLVIACPCTLGLATPAALVAGTGAAAKAGILIRDIETLERADATDTVIFDKTGTLTKGKPSVVAVHALSDEAAMIRLAAAAQSGSEHPLAKAILAHAGGIDLPPVAGFLAIEGGGLTATVEGHALVICTRESRWATPPFMVSARDETFSTAVSVSVPTAVAMPRTASRTAFLESSAKFFCASSISRLRSSFSRKTSSASAIRPISSARPYPAISISRSPLAKWRVASDMPLIGRRLLRRIRKINIPIVTRTTPPAITTERVSEATTAWVSFWLRPVYSTPITLPEASLIRSWAVKNGSPRMLAVPR